MNFKNSWKKIRICKNPDCEKEYMPIIKRQQFHNTACGLKYRKYHANKFKKETHVIEKLGMDNMLSLTYKQLQESRDESKYLVRHHIEMITHHKRELFRQQTTFNNSHRSILIRDTQKTLDEKKNQEEQYRKFHEKKLEMLNKVPKKRAKVYEYG